MEEDRTTRIRMRDTISASFVFEPAEGGLHVLVLAVVPPAGHGPPRVLFTWVDPNSRETGRTLFLPYGSTRSPPVEWLAHGFRVEVDEALPLIRFLDAELPRLICPSSDPRDQSQDGDFDPTTETDEVPK